MGGGGGRSSELNHAKQDLSDKDLRKLLLDKAIGKPDYHVIDFSENRLSFVGLEQVLEIGRRCHRLRILKLYKNQICDRGADALVGLITTCKTIEEIHLSHNNFTVEGVALIVTAASSRPSNLPPLWLRLEHNDVDKPRDVIRDFESCMSVCATAADSKACSKVHCCKNKKVHLPYFHLQRGTAQGKGKGKDDGKGKVKGRGRDRRSSQERDVAAHEAERPREIVLTARLEFERSDSQGSKQSGSFRQQEHRRSRSRPCRNGNRHIRVGSKGSLGSAASGSDGVGGASLGRSRRHERVRDNGVVSRRSSGAHHSRHRTPRDRAEYTEGSRGIGRRRHSVLANDEVPGERRVRERTRRRRSDEIYDGRGEERARRPLAHVDELVECQSRRVSSRHELKRDEASRQHQAARDEGIGAAWAGVPGGPKPKSAARGSPLSPTRLGGSQRSLKDVDVNPGVAVAAAEDGSASMSSSEVSDTDLDEAEEIDHEPQAGSAAPSAERGSASAAVDSTPTHPPGAIPVAISPDGDSSISGSCSEDGEDATVPTATATNRATASGNAEESSSSPSQAAPHDPYCDAVEYGHQHSGERLGSPSSEQSDDLVSTKVEKRMQSLKERLTLRMQGSQKL